MPKLIWEKTLSALCIEFIKENVSEICSLASMRVPSDEIAYDEMTPFVFLPPVHIEQLVETLSWNNLLKGSFLRLLLTPSLRTLNFFQCEDSSVADLLIVASRKCQELTSLYIGTFGYLLDCRNLLPKFKQLEVLDISKSNCPDSILRALGANCTNLKELYVNESAVTDNGIRDLCVTGSCNAIKQLSLFNGFDGNPECMSLVSREGITVALNHLPDMNNLCHVSVVEALAKMQETVTQDQKPVTSKYELTTLNIRQSSKYTRGNLSAAISMCKRPTQIKIVAPDNFFDEDLMELSLAVDVNDISISGGTTVARLSFSEGIAPVLRNFIGTQLLSLSLVNMDNTRVPLIVSYCPNLQNLTLGMKTGSLYHGPELTNVLPLQSLQRLNIVNCSSSLSILLLLSSPSLLTVVLRECSGLNNDSLQSASLDHFRQLENLKIILNSRVTKDGIEALLIDNNPLKFIRLEGVSSVSTDDIIHLKTIIREHNWSLSIEVSQFRTSYWLAIDRNDLFFPLHQPTARVTARRDL